jgi:hypothetical protein
MDQHWIRYQGLKGLDAFVSGNPITAVIENMSSSYCPSINL